jgi:hypothetical protein
MEGFLGTGAPMRADLTLLAYILILAPAMIAGYVFARRKMFIPHHKYVMTGIVVVNWVLIVAVMVASYANYVAPSLGDNLGDVSIALPTLHLITGGIAQLLGTYLVALMWTENTALEKFVPRIKNIKLPMRITLGLWAITVTLGILMYVVWYVTPPASADEGTAPVATEEAPVATDEADAPLITEEAPLAEDDVPEEDGVPAPASTEDANNG